MRLLALWHFSRNDKVVDKDKSVMLRKTLFQNFTLMCFTLGVLKHSLDQRQVSIHRSPGKRLCLDHEKRARDSEALESENLRLCDVKPSEAIYILPKYVRYLLLHNIKLHRIFAKLMGYYF